MATAAQKLVGQVLEGGWRVIERLDLSNTTGGCFSEAYLIEGEGGTRAFLKALDYSGALESADPASALQALTESYNFERQVLKRCSSRRFDRIVKSLADGKVNVGEDGESEVVQYIIFELADGDLHQQDGALKDLAWILRSLHHVATGIAQLHSIGIAHQDVKPSNVVVFNGNVSKVTDLGRSAQFGSSAPHEDYEVAGDPTYAPPELLYGSTPSDWNRRRFGCDLYLLGSMISNYFVRQGITPLIHMYLAREHTHRFWAGSYENVLPYIRQALSQALVEVTAAIPETVREELIRVVRELCEPDPALRGYPRNRGVLGNQYSLERYVAKFDLLARRAEIERFKKKVTPA